MANVAYIRVSTKEQNTGRQHSLMSGIDFVKVFEEKISGKNIKDRPQLKAMLDYVREGDTVIVESISRLARNTRDLLNIIDVLQEKDVEFKSLKENIDTTTPQGKFMLSVFGAMSQLERDTIRQRQQEGIELCLSEGRQYGRPQVTFSGTFADNYKQWKEGKITAVECMHREGLAKTTFYRMVKKYEEDQR